MCDSASLQLWPVETAFYRTFPDRHSCPTALVASGDDCPQPVGPTSEGALEGSATFVTCQLARQLCKDGACNVDSSPSQFDAHVVARHACDLSEKLLRDCSKGSPPIPPIPSPGQAKKTWLLPLVAVFMIILLVALFH